MDIITLAAQFPFLVPFLGYISLVIAVSAVISRFLDAPDEASAKWYKTFYKVVNTLGQNVGKAGNADDAKKVK